MGADGKPAPGDPPEEFNLPEEYRKRFESPPGPRGAWKNLNRAEQVRQVRLQFLDPLRDSERLAGAILDGTIPPDRIDEMVRDAPNDPMVKDALRKAYRTLRERTGSEIPEALVFGLADLEAGIVQKRMGRPSTPHIPFVRGMAVAIMAWNTGRNPTRNKATKHEESAADIVAEGTMTGFPVVMSDYSRHGARFLRRWRELETG